MYRIVLITGLLMLMIAGVVSAAEIISLGLGKSGPVIHPDEQELRVTLNKPAFTVPKDVTLHIELSGPAHFENGDVSEEERFASIDESFGKSYTIQLDRNFIGSSTLINISADVSYFKSRKQWWFFGERVKTEEKISESANSSFVAVWTDTRIVENELAECTERLQYCNILSERLSSEQESLTERFNSIEDEQLALKAEAYGLAKYRTYTFVGVPAALALGLIFGLIFGRRR